MKVIAFDIEVIDELKKIAELIGNHSLDANRKRDIQNRINVLLSRGETIEI